MNVVFVFDSDHQPCSRHTYENMLNPQLRLLLYVAAVLFLILDTANCFNSFVPLRIYFSLASPSPRSSLLPLLPSSPSRRPPPYVSRLRSPTVPPFGRASGSRAGVVNPDNESPSASSDKAIKTEKQLADLKGEIDAVTAKIDDKEAERKTETNGTEKGVLLKSIDTLYEALKDLRATRAKLIEAGIAAPVPVPVPGKSVRAHHCMNFVPCAVDAPLFVCICD